jgi:hypothetical protein
VSNNYGIEYIYPNNIFTAIAPFWSDIDTNECGDIYFRETKDMNTLSLISFIILISIWYPFTI